MAGEQEYPTEHNREEREGNSEPHAQEDDEASVCSSEARDRKDLEECSGEDLRAVPTEHSGYYVMLFYVIFSGLSFVLMLAAACPVPWLQDGDGQKWTIWKNQNGVQWKNYPCDHKRAMFQAMEAFSIAGCVLSLACFIGGVLQMLGRGHLGVTMLLAVVDMGVLLVDWSLIVNQYHKYNCPGETAYVARINRLSAGFALSFCSFGMMVFAVVALGYWMSEVFSLPELHRDNYSGAALFSALITGSCLTIATVGTAHTMWESYFTTYTLKITYWHVEFYDRDTGLSEYWGLDSYGCSKFKNQMHAGAAFSIISDAFLFITLLCAVGSVYNRCCKWLTIGFGAASWVFLLICWAITVAARYTKYCQSSTSYFPVGAPMNLGSQSIDFTGFVITEGLGMIISAWCAMTLNLIYLGIKG